MDGIFKHNKWKAPVIPSNDKYNMYMTAYTFRYVGENASLFESLNEDYEQHLLKLAEYDTPTNDETKETENGLSHL